MLLKRQFSLFLGISILAVLVVAVLVSACGTAAAAEVPLKYSYKAGDSWAYEMTVVMNGTAEGFGATDSSDTSIPKDTTAKIRVGATVKEVTDGVATVVFSYKTLEASADGQPIDTGEQSSQDVTMKIDQTGKVLSVEGLESGGVASGLVDSGLPFDPTEFTNQFSVPFPPDGLGKVGDEWSATSKFPIPGVGQELTATTKAKLTAVATENGRQIATIDYTVNLPMDLTIDLGTLLQQMGESTDSTDLGDVAFKMTMAGAMDFTGTAKVDTADGRTISSDGNATLKVEMAISEAPEDMVPQSERGPFTMDMILSIKMQEVN